MFIFEHSLFANGFLDNVRRGTRNSKYFSEIDCLHDPIENEKGGANCVVKKIQQTVNHMGSRRTLKSSSLFRDKIL